MGWFFGFKAHLVINQYGELVNFVLTPGNVADNNAGVLAEALEGLQGQCLGDRGYLTAQAALQVVRYVLSARLATHYQAPAKDEKRIDAFVRQVEATKEGANRVSQRPADIGL
jgi:hypothetical protein